MRETKIIFLWVRKLLKEKGLLGIHTFRLLEKRQSSFFPDKECGILIQQKKKGV